MSENAPSQQPDSSAGKARKKTNDVSKKRRRFLLLFILLVLLIFAGGAVTSLARSALTIKSELSAARELGPALEEDLLNKRSADASELVEALESHTMSAVGATANPVWTLASGLPLVGQNFTALSEVSRSANDVATLGVAPLVKVYDSLNWDQLLPSTSGVNLQPLADASPTVSAAAHAVAVSAERLNQLDTSTLLPQIAGPLSEARSQLSEVKNTLIAAADASVLAPDLLGHDKPMNYLLIVQNNAEARASGGIPGALAVIRIDGGKLSLGEQSSASDLGPFVPGIDVDTQQQQIFSTRLGKYMQDVNLTPDFPTAATTARSMWAKKTGKQVDGVISIDPVVLSYILQSTGPVVIGGPELAEVKATGLPTELNGNNVVPTLLSDVYSKIPQPRLQDAYFAGVAEEVFAALSTGKAEAKGLITGITRGVEEGRVLIWSADATNQAVISKYPLSGSISGPSVSPAQFGIYFNDGTGAKMDYYVKRTVQLIKECPADGYEQTRVRITSTNTAPPDAATSLPTYVTGGGAFGVPPGSVQTNVVAYGPVQANVESVAADDRKVPFAPYLHANRPVGVVAQRLGPGESKTVEFTFGKIVQHTEPNVVVTPSVQPVNNVVLPTENASCDKE